MKPRLPSRASRSQLSELRRLLRSEAKTLLVEFARATQAQQQALQRVLKAIERSEDAKLMGELPNLRKDVEIARRALARIALAGQSTEKLRTEWNDWERHAAYVDDAHHSTKRERQEMIASELRMRGVRMPVTVSEPVSSITEEMPTSISDEPVEAVAFAVIQTDADDLVSVEEDEPMMSEESLAYWDALIASLPPECTDERSLARLLGAYRRVQGEQKRQDQRKGSRRYRMGAFDAWS